jgi:hypothetical protein
MHLLKSTVKILVFSGVFLAVPSARGEAQDARDLVRAIVKSELAADASDHSRWIFRDANKTHVKNTVKLTVQTAQGDLSKIIEIDGRPPSPEDQREDAKKRQQFVNDPGLREKQKRDQQQDDKKAAALTKMLPDTFLWKVANQKGEETTLEFKPNPQFKPPTREARVFAAMEGTMVVDTKQKRIKSLKGKLTQNVNFGGGLLGRLDRGGTFDVERRQIAPKVWEITETHVHIRGHALIFKSISEQQDEETSDYKPTPPSLTLMQAAKLLGANTAVGSPLGQ